MSKYQQPCLYRGHALDNQWMNIIFQSHALFCGCDSTIKHLQDIISKQQWLHTEEKPTTSGEKDDHTKQDFDIENGDLEQLFAATEDAEG